VVLDGVFNHSGRGFFAFHDLVENGEASPYRSWFSVRSFPVRPYGPGDHGYAAWCDNPALPKLATENPEVREYLMRVAEHWVERGIDGWRLDTPEQIETAGFWEEFRERTKKKNPELYLVGEVWTDARSWIGDAGRFDGVLNYYFGGRTLAFVGRESLDLSVCENIDYPLKRSIDATEMARFSGELCASLPEQALLSCLNLDSSHDTPRLLTLLSGDRDRVQLAKLLQFGFAGAPCILYGDEIGLAGAGDPACRLAFPWDDPGRHDLELSALVRDLARLRREHPALRRGSVTVLDAGPEIFGFLREHAEDRVLVVANPGEHAVRVPLYLTANSVERAAGKGVLSPAQGHLALELPAKSGGIWSLAG
jgi:glycosidase